ncbi:MAG: LamG-like jellyroll fold domain-containing protein, partial [Bacteroidota bacterium]
PHRANLEIIPNGDFTIEAWVNVENTATFKTIVAKGGGNFASNTSYFFSISSGHKINLFLSNGSSSINRESNTSLTPGTWHHVAVTYDFNSRTMWFYLDGVLDGSHTNAFFSSSQGDTQELFIGRQGWDCGCNPFDGSLDEVRIWQQERTSAQIAASSQWPPDAPQSGLNAYYQFNEGSGTTTDDSAGISNPDGTLVNSPTWNPMGFPTPSISPATNNWLEFDGATDYVEVSSYSDGSSGAATIEAWIKHDPITSFPERTIIEFDSQNKLVLAGSAIRLVSNGAFAFTEDFTPYFGQETHIAVSIANGSQTLYINGFQEANGTASFSGYSGSFLIGAETISSDYDGKMTDIRLWNTARTSTQIRDNISSALTGSESGLRAYYNFSEGTGTTLGDVTSNNYDGILHEGTPNQSVPLANVNGPRWTTDPDAISPEFISSTFFSAEEDYTGFVFDANARIGSGGGLDVGLTYSISGTDASFFSINSSNGHVSLNTALDFDAPSDANTDNLYEIVITATSSNLSENRFVTVQITDTDCTIDNEAPGGAGSGSGYFSINADFNLFQTFQPCATGDLKNIKLVANVVPTSGNLKIWPVTGFFGGQPTFGVQQGEVNLNS